MTKISIILSGTKNDATTAPMPVSSVSSCAMRNLFFMPINEKSKSCARFELTAHKSESAVEVTAAAIAHSAIVATNPLVKNSITGIKGLAPGAISILSSLKQELRKQKNMHLNF